MKRRVILEIRSPEDQRRFEHMRDVLAMTLGLDWKAMAGEPAGWEIAESCAEDLWAAGVRPDVTR